MQVHVVKVFPIRVYVWPTHCNTMQHTATHCNTLQHTLTHQVLCIWEYGNALQHIATHCNTLQQTATHCNALQHTATHCNALQHTATHCNTLQHTEQLPNNSLQLVWFVCMCCLVLWTRGWGRLEMRLLPAVALGSSAELSTFTATPPRRRPARHHWSAVWSLHEPSSLCFFISLM